MKNKGRRSTGKHNLYLVLHNIRSAHNVGSIFRTADASGVKKIFLCGITPTPQKQELGSKNQGAAVKIAKTALGAEKTVSWEYHSQTWRCLLKLKNNLPAGGKKLEIVGLEQTKKSKNIFKFKPTFPLAIVVGHERRGLSKKILEYVDEVVEIPMFGRKESLNVAVAVGVALYCLFDN